MTNSFIKENSSFKDKDSNVGFIENKLIRKIYKNYKPTFEEFINCGLYEELKSKNLIIEHKKTFENEEELIIEPEEIFISYPWEWSFSMLKDAALATLEILKISLKYDFILKDANYFNIQFKNNKPLLIDTTSFTKFEQKPWEGYGQFCTNFLAPLLLMAHKDLNLINLILGNISGIDLSLTSKLLPKTTWFNLDILFHIHLHANLLKQYGKTKKKIENKLSKKQMIYFIESLINTTKKINLNRKQTQWAKYYDFTNYSELAFEDKKQKILEFAALKKPNKIIDFGANTGIFSRLFKDCEVYSLDFDRLAIEYNYLYLKENKINNIFPLVYDIMNPSCDLGFMNKERKNLQKRLKKTDLALALALIHHLRITNNLPFEYIAEFFKEFANNLIIEFIEKNDSKMQQMLLNRKDIFEDYTIENFEKEFSKYFKIIKKEQIKESSRILYLMESYE